MYVKCLGCCLLVGLVLQSAGAQSVGLGKCPENIKVVNDFDVLKYLGVWYEQYRYFTVFQPGRKCTVTNYTRNDDGTVEVSTSQQNRWVKSDSTVNGTLKFAGTNLTEGKLTLFTNSAADKGAPYWIIGTDYNTYASVWACQEVLRINTPNSTHHKGHHPRPVPEHYTRTRVVWVEIFSNDEPIPPTATMYHYEYGWILTREQVPSEQTLEKAKEDFKKNNLTVRFLTKTEQATCVKAARFDAAESVEALNEDYSNIPDQNV
ncbi:hypothetical protein M8J76_000917 [Diaphorina citri]|nr:hypothetical protein M8J75_007522 [Diaphorina citri]KAI5748649.1 hypothetical protein M8J76_000917 [Diaphorina citri]